MTARLFPQAARALSIASKAGRGNSLFARFPPHTVGSWRRHVLSLCGRHKVLATAGREGRRLKGTGERWYLTRWGYSSREVRQSDDGECYPWVALWLTDEENPAGLGWVSPAGHRSVMPDMQDFAVRCVPAGVRERWL